MLLSRLALASVLAFANVASSQVIVTITNTVTVVTVTVTPKSTSISYTYVTVTGSSPPLTTASTSTLTVVVTATGVATPTGSSCPIEEWGQCGGEGYGGSCGRCASNAVCKYKDIWYSYCSNLPEVVHAVSTIYMP
ncbi:uncharacterized protein LY89DRAFT_279228 [Mollisia scopiformis]|uniref:CBM1 domain-containing protein n=1 Tax=Mollisia scopiformis TaxID=149040 RepID=A0A132BBW8_MOLSC|nr:uncharacterized protein LY89DRAFT_279228 [Mollisia scopiformis]KUJ09871.1 hypothetical protein LY89DRAFT_279228 [Mollisia scopiformis]